MSTMEKPGMATHARRERARIVAWLRARAHVWRTAKPVTEVVRRENVMVADALDGAANSIERGNYDDE